MNSRIFVTPVYRERIVDFEKVAKYEDVSFIRSIHTYIPLHYLYHSLFHPALSDSNFLITYVIIARCCMGGLCAYLRRLGFGPSGLPFVMSKVLCTRPISFSLGALHPLSLIGVRLLTMVSKARARGLWWDDPAPRGSLLGTLQACLG